MTQAGEAPAELAASRLRALDLVLAASTEMEARVLVAGVGDGRTASTLGTDTRLVAEGANDLMRENALECRQQQIRDAYGELVGGGSPRKLDVVAALRGLNANLGQIEGETDVVVLGSMLDTATLDLDDPSALEDPAAAINELATAGLNFDCSGWSVYVVGGSVANDKPAPSEVDSRAQEFWRQYFEHCGGSLVVWASELTEFPVDTGTIVGANYSTIPIQIERRPGLVEATLGDVLFAVDSADLMDEADAALRDLLPSLAEARGAVKVAGYTDNTGSDAINLPLSEGRAEAVAAWIVEQATIDPKRIRATGFGSGDPIASNATEEGRAQNRRVVVTIRVAGR